MGLFGSKKTYVASTVQNMAGDELKRPDYLKTIIVGAVMADQEGISDVLQRSYLKGPGMKLRSFFRWSNTHFSAIGLPTAKIGHVIDTGSIDLGQQIPVPEGQAVMVQTIQVGVADYSYWAEQYILQYAQDQFDTDWSADVNDDTNQIIITYEDGSIVSFLPSDFNRDKTYIYAGYITINSGSTGPVDQSNLIPIGTAPFPSTAGYTVLSEDHQTIPIQRKKTTTVVVVSDVNGETDRTTSEEFIDDTYDKYTGHFTRDVYTGTDDDPNTDDSTNKEVQTLDLYGGYALVNQTTESSTTTVNKDNGYIEHITTTTTITTQVKIDDRAYQDSSQPVVIKEFNGPYLFIYKIGSGNPILDAVATDDDPTGDNEFFPFIPIRLENTFLSESYYPDAYAQAKKGFKKAVDGDIDDVIKSLNESENLKDIDFVYAVFGVSANVRENACKKYLYNFFKQLMSIQESTITNYSAWRARVIKFQDSLTAWLEWKEDQKNPLSAHFGQAEPKVLAYPSTPTSKLKIASTSTFPNGYNFELSWQGISETNGFGLAKPDAKVGDLWFATVDSDTYSHDLYFNKSSLSVMLQEIGEVRLYWQKDTNHWIALDIIGMTHRNYVYGAKYVEISLIDGLEDTEDSGFIVPLHYPTIQSMSLIDTTQMSTACTFLVFNSYIIKKTGLLGSLFFKIFLIVVIIAVVVFAPELAPGLVHAAAATGAAVGLSGTAALIAGAAINAIAAMVVTSVIMRASIAIFGEKLGLIIGTIASIVAANGLTNLVNGNGLTINFGNMMSAQNITLLTSSVGNVYAKFVALDTLSTMKDTADLQKEYDSKKQEIEDLFAQNFGYGNGVIDPLQLLDSSQMLIEQSEAFLSRTLMTGTDIAQLSMDMLGSFADITLSNDLALT